MATSPPLVRYSARLPQSDYVPQATSGCYGRSWSKIAQASIAFALFSTALGVYASDTLHIRSHLGSRSFTEVFGGSMVTWLGASLLSRHMCSWIKSGISDYASASFLLLSQVFLNLPQKSQEASQPYFFGYFNFHGGMAIAAYIHSVLTKRVQEGAEAPLVDMTNREQKQRYHMLYGTTRRRMVIATAMGAAGIAAIILGSTYKPAKIFRDLGIIFTGRAFSYVISELWWRSTIPAYTEEHQRSIQSGESPKYSWNIRHYSSINRVMLVAFHALPGVLVSAAEISEENRIHALSIFLFALHGFTMGWNEHLRQLRFSEVCTSELHEVRQNHERIFPPKSFFGWGKWFIGVPCVLTFTGLTIAGYNPDLDIFQKANPYVISSITAFAVSLYASFFFSEVSRIKFEKEGNTPLVNTCYYLGHYASGVPLFFIYFMEKLLINDQGLDLDGPLAGSLSTIAWWSLGWAMGRDASKRTDEPHPRVIDSLYLALFGRYFINLISGRA